MGAGRKTQTFYPGDSISWPPLSGDGSTLSSRNLRKSDLGGVIFGCKHNTMQECLSKQLFGLPHGHFSYVRNIGEGLPLFLFNYSDRKLHGIYEAASNGHMSFDAYAWTDGGTERTPFPAQVYIRIKMQCQPLTENQFRKVIVDNYFTTQHFWFELDHAQTRGLIALFKPFPSDILPAPYEKELYPALLDKKCVPSNKKELSTALPATKSKPILRNEVNESKSSSVHCNDGDVWYSSSNKTSCTSFEDMDSKDTVSDWEDFAENNVRNLSVGVNLQVCGMNHTSEKQQSGTEGLEKEEERILRLLQKLAADREQLKSSSSGGNSTGPDCNHEGAEAVHISTLPNVNYVKGEDEENSTMSDISHTNVELVQAIEELKERTSILEKQRAEQDREMEHLRNAFRDAGREIQFLNDRVKELSKAISLVDDSREKDVAQYFSPDDVIYLIGGFDGYSWLSALDSFTPALDIVKPLRSMSFARSYASTVSLDGMIYVFGGGDGSLWFDSVEIYNRTYDKWTSCPSMLREKGSLAGASLNGKIFVIGGGNGVECFSDVEMFDPAAGIWIKNQPMIHTRFAPAAVELNGVIYALGGYDGNAYLRSVERFDPREGTWAEALSMNIRRGCHSVAVFNEKLYCMGGYNGEKMVSSLEIFDPRLDSWVMGEPMKSERGFAATAVLGKSLLAMGGVKDDKIIIDTVECYREGAGWTTSGLKAIGKRCFCSAIVL